MATLSKSTIEASYDSIAPRYLEWSKHSPARMKYLNNLQKLLSAVSKQAAVLELGCGAGVPCTKVLAENGHRITANDISAAQIELATKHVPSDHVTFVKSDMMALDFAPQSFDAVVAFYSVFHLPREEQRTMFQRMNAWLRPDGLICTNLAATDDPGSVNNNWLGKPMFWSSFDVAMSKDLVQEAGFSIISAEVLEDDEDGRAVPFLWILARKWQA